MKKFLPVLVAALLVGVLGNVTESFAQGNIYWVEMWVNLPPSANDPNNPNNWMRGSKSYTSLAYDKWNDVVYIVNPKDCFVGQFFFRCPEIHAWDAETGTVANHIGDPANGTGKLYVDTDVMRGSFSQGQYEIYRIDIDDEGRIFVCNVLAPIWGICYPGPPPNCDPDYLSQGPFKVYRYDDHEDDPRLVYQTAGSGPTNTEMTWTMWGTAFDVVGARHDIIVDGKTVTRDSVRIFASGGKFYSGEVSVNDEINVFLEDEREGAPLDYRLGLYLLHNEPGSGIAAHGIAATGPFMESQLYMDSNFRETVLNNQGQDPNQPLPQLVSMALNQSLAGSVTGESGSIAYFLDDRYDRPYLVLSDGNNSSPEIWKPNNNTRARVIDLSASPDPVNWPPQATPQIGAGRLVNLTGIDNFINDIDYKVWIHPDSGTAHLQVFVLISGNGIASYRTRDPIPDPVELETFKGFVNGNQIDLVWQINSEYNNHGFEVHRSFDGGDSWENIGFVEGRGTTSTQGEYNFTDPMTEVHKNIGVVKYRLRQVDFDGTFMWSPVTDVYIDAAPTSVSLYQNYPNPFNPSTSISYQIQEPSFVTLKVFNAIGEEVATLVNENKASGVHVVDFDASGLTSGTYMYQINAGGVVLEKKMVLMK
ncbi:MAG: hypothetical protein CL946_06440 [Ectothiorhodospiraceae bacterium]|nr:hypothetical protein [Ectothiorhodospiraceae bacterium]